MPNQQSSTVGHHVQASVDTTMSQILDLFSQPALEQKVIDVTPVKKRKAKAPKPDKFVISKELKNVLSYIRDNGTEAIAEICNNILNREFVGEDGLNYLGVAKEDPTKMSYLDKARSEKFKDQKTIKNVIKKGCVIKYGKKRDTPSWWHSETRPDHSYLNFVPNEVRITDTNIHCFSPSGPDIPITNIEVEILGTPDQDGFYSLDDLRFHFSEAALQRAVSNEVRLHIYKGRSRNWNSETLRVSVESGFAYFSNSDYTFSEPKITLKQIKTEKVWQDQVRYMSTPGKVIRKLLGSNMSDNDLTAFSELFKEYSAIGVPGYTYREEQGEKIRENYLGENYLEGSAGLNNSCMRYERCQRFLNIYVETPGVKLATLYYKNKVAARGLLWCKEDVTYVDRLYYANNESENILKNLVRKYKPIYNTNCGIVDFPVDKSFMEKQEAVPYMDSLYFYDFEREVLTNQEPSGKYMFMRNQHGTINIRGYRCPHCNGSVSEDSTVEYYVYQGGGMVLAEDRVCEICVTRVYFGGSVYTVLRDQTTMVDYTMTGSRCLSEFAITLFNGDTADNSPGSGVREYQNGYGYFWLNDHEYVKDPETGLYYALEDPNKPVIEEEEAEESDELFWDDLGF